MAKVAAVQMCSSGVVKENLATSAALIKEAADHHAQLVVLPEMFAIMGANATDKAAEKEILHHGVIQSFLSACAKENKIWIVGGTIPIACDHPDKVRAASLVFDDQGKMVARYDKIHLFDVVVLENEVYKESDTTEPGDNLVVVDTPVGKLGLTVCYDIRFPGLFQALLKKGAEIFAIPAAFTVKTGEAHWELLCRARAVENFCYVIGACQGGAHANGRSTYGHALIVEPWGRVVATLPGVEQGVIYADIDLAKLHEIRKAVPTLQHESLAQWGGKSSIN